MKVTVLMENTALEGCGLMPEHGLSLYIEYRGKKLLLDAGSSGKFADNARALGVDLSAVEAAALSHGHYDHADGLRRFFACNGRAPVYVRPGAFGPYFVLDPDSPRFIGVHRDIPEQFRSRFVQVKERLELAEGVWLVPVTVHDPDFSGRATNLVYKRGEDDFVPDDYRHEQTLVLEGERGLVLCSSCSHSGIVNIVRGVREQLPGRKLFAVVGGFHMHSKGGSGMNCSPEFVRRTAQELKHLGVEEIYTGHCTGAPALAVLQECFGPGCLALSTGQTLEL